MKGKIVYTTRTENVPAHILAQMREYLRKKDEDERLACLSERRGVKAWLRDKGRNRRV